MIDEVKFLALLAKLYMDTKNASKAVDILTQAKEQQSRILKRANNEIPDYAAQKALAARLAILIKQLTETWIKCLTYWLILIFQPVL